MEIIPHIDVVGDDRVQAILDDPRNFNLRAIRAERYIDWLPDLGTYDAPATCRSQNGLFRTPGLANSGLPAILRHRFFIAEEAARVTGTRYIGLLIYDKEGDDYVFELSAGSEAVGAVRPWRHDNRRHLIVASRPAQILGGHIPFTVRALGRGLCYLESVIFMPECPAPSAFIPEIDRLSAHVVTRDKASVKVHLITREAATVRAEATAEGQVDGPVCSAEEEELDTVHALMLRGLEPGVRYRVQVQATEPGGASAEASLVVDTSPAEEDAGETVVVPVELVRLGEYGATGLPLTFGVPIARGKVVQPRRCTLRSAGREMVAQTRVHARWPDGSARWVLVDVPCPEALHERTSVLAELVIDEQNEKPLSGLAWRTTPGGIVVEGQLLRVSVSRDGPLPASIERRTETGGWQQVFGQDAVCLVARLGNGLKLTNGPITGLELEEAGTERAVICYELPLIDEKGITHLRNTIRLHVYARMPFVRLVLRTVVSSPVLGAAFGSENLDHLTSDLEHLRSALAGEEGELTSLLRVETMWLRLPWTGKVSDSRWRVVHEHDQAYRVEVGNEVRHQQGHWPGVLFLEGEQASFGVCVKHFWQSYPKAIHHGDGPVTLEILPKLSGKALPDYDEQWHKLYAWYDADRAQYRLKTGLALTTELLIGFPEHEVDVQAWQQWLEHPVVARPTVDYLNATHALLPTAPKLDSLHPRYEAMMDQSVDDWTRQVARRHEYGFMNYGDTYSDAEHFWSNNEYDAAYCHYVEFLRGGDPRWFLLGNQTVCHMLDVDTCNYSREASQVGAQYVHTPGHVGGLLPPFFRSKSGGSASIPSHTWVEGAVLHYLLTGDEAVRSVIMRTGLRLTRGLQYYDFINMRECGWHIIHLCGLARMGDDPRFLNAAAVIVEKVLGKQEPGGGWEHPLSEGHCHCDPPRCHGEAGFMVGVVLSALRRFYELCPDPRVAEAIVGGTRWLLAKTYVPEAGHFRYTSCPNHGGPAPGYTLQVIEALADASLFARDRHIAQVLRRALDDIGLSNGQRYGRHLSMEARYIPTMLHALKDIDLGADDAT